MKRKGIIIVCLVSVVFIALAITILFGLSYTRDYYACDGCESLGESEALHIFVLTIRLKPIHITDTLTGKQCDHEWRRYFANSKGILLNQENWDGPLGDYPWDEWTQNMENKRTDSGKQ